MRFLYLLYQILPKIALIFAGFVSGTEVVYISGNCMPVNDIIRGMSRTVSIILNSIIVVVMAVTYVTFFRREGKWSASNGRRPLKYFTFLSNVFCAVASLLVIIFPDVYAVFLVKYAGTVAVTVTMVTVLVFLGPVLGYKRVLQKQDFWLHIVNPVLAIVSFGVFERQALSVPAAFLGLLPVVLYGILYGYKVMLAPEEKRWEDFYGFNKGGKWYISVCLMLLGTAAVCVAFRAGMHFTTAV